MYDYILKGTVIDGIHETPIENGLVAISGAWTKYLLVPLAAWERILLGLGGVAVFVPLPDIIQYPVVGALLVFFGYLYYRMKTEKVCVG